MKKILIRISESCALCCLSMSTFAVDFDDPYAEEIESGVCQSLQSAYVSSAHDELFTRVASNGFVVNLPMVQSSSCELVGWDEAWITVAFDSHVYGEATKPGAGQMVGVDYKNSGTLKCFFTADDYEWKCGFSRADFTAFSSGVVTSRGPTPLPTEPDEENLSLIYQEEIHQYVEGILESNF